MSMSFGVQDEAAAVESGLYVLLSDELTLKLASHVRVRVGSLQELGKESLVLGLLLVFTFPRPRLQLKEALLGA